MRSKERDVGREVWVFDVENCQLLIQRLGASIETLSLRMYI